MAEDLYSTEAVFIKTAGGVISASADSFDTVLFLFLRFPMMMFMCYCFSFNVEFILCVE